MKSTADKPAAKPATLHVTPKPVVEKDWQWVPYRNYMYIPVPVPRRSL